jgi:phosphatidylserine/phosphatidylglycerophosphate/cardiolipin synthase-like enzyme
MSRTSHVIALYLSLLLALVACQPPEATVPDLGAASSDGALSLDGVVTPDTQPAPDAFVSTACKATDPRATPVQVGVLPDDGEKPYVEVIKRAKKTIRVQIYLMGYGGILDTLQAKAKQGLDVRVILDPKSSNTKYYTLLTDAGAKVTYSDQKWSYYHAKVIIVDTAEAVVSTGNYSLKYAIQRSRDFTAHTADPQDVHDMITVFEADWKHTSVSLPCTRLLVSPINARQRLLDLINSATSTLEVESMQLADKEIRAAIAARKQAGVTVRVILAAPSWIDSNTWAGSFLKGYQIPARWLATPGIHSKAIVADGTTAYVGSINFSYTSLTKNREVGLVFSDSTAVKRLSDTFTKDWAVATAF